MREGGYALILAIVVLAALLAIATPFILTANLSNKSSVSRGSEVRSRIEASSAISAIIRRLEATDPELDATPVFDLESEVRLQLDLPADLYPMRNPSDAIVSASSTPESGRIDINSGSVYAIGAVLGHGFLAEELKKDATEISIDNAEDFPDRGCLWIRGELIQYQQKKGNKFIDCTRQVMGSPSGPYEDAKEYRSGTPVVDARAVAVVKHRIKSRPGQFVNFESIGELTRVKMDAPGCPPITEKDLRRCGDWFTVHGTRNGHEEWSAPFRVAGALQADGIVRTLRLDSGRYFGIGTTVKLTTPTGVEYGIVVNNNNTGVILAEPVTQSAAAYEAMVQFLVPSPVHLHSTDPELLEALLTGLEIERTGSSEPLSRELVRKLIAAWRAKPARSWQEFVQNGLLPFANDGTLPLHQVEAILRAAENSNDRVLKFGTVPFSLTSGSRHRIRAAAVVNAESGLERGRSEVETVVEVHPQARDRENIGIRFTGRQIEFDEAFRLSRRGRGWMTFPYTSSVFDTNADPPSRARAFMNIFAQLGESVPLVQSSELTQGQQTWAQLWPSRSAFPDNLSQHFDFALTQEGQDVRTLGAWRNSATAPPTQFAAQNPNYLFPGSISGWVRFDAGTISGTIFDIGSTQSAVRDRVSLLIENGFLIARMRDPGGDDTNNLANVAGQARNEIRYPASNLKANTWYHFTIAFRGSGPNDFTLFVDGLPRGARQLATRLTGQLSPMTQFPDFTQIPVESTDGFPGFGVLKIGGELVEYTGKASGAFITTRPTGNAPGSYTGGRGARGTFTTQTGLNYLMTHAAGDAVEFYGYSCKLVANVFAGGGQLTAGIGRFSGGHVSRTQSGLQLKSIDIATAGPGGQPLALPLGRGIEATTPIPQLRLAPLDVMEPNNGGSSATCDGNFIKAFSPQGGYAVMFQLNPPGGVSNLTTAAPFNSPLFGAEVIRYGGVSGSDTLTGIQRIQQPTQYFRPSAYIFDWNINVPQGHGNDSHFYWTYVIPCSVGVSGGSYEQPAQTLQGAGNYIAAQLIELGASGVGLDLTTEWINYDTFLNGEMCVFADWRWELARSAVTTAPPVVNLGTNPPTISPAGTVGFPNPPPGCVTYQSNQTSLGEPPSQAIPGLVDRIARGTGGFGGGIQFRGTNGTWSRDHTVTTEVIPCFKAYYGSIFAGRAGRNDRVRFLFPQNITFPNFDPYVTINWVDLYQTHTLWVATKERIPAAVTVGALSQFSPELPPNGGVFEDSRNSWRIIKTPSGELPANATTVSAGGRFDGPGDEIAGTIDELEFTNPLLTAGPVSIAKLIIDQAFDASAKTFSVSPIVGSQPFNISTNPIGAAVALPGGAKSLSGQVFTVMPADAGVVQVGSELIGYDSFDAGAGTFTVAANGRGMLGTRATAHGPQETVIFMDHLVATTVAGGATPGVSRIPFEDSTGFPPDGTLLIGSELVHYTWIDSGGFSMPDFGDDFGVGADYGPTSVNLKRKGDGIFRGRFGTVPASHSPGEIILKFPFRYWDRWTLGADVPEMHYLQFDEEMETGFWRQIWWDEVRPEANVTLECVVRLDGRSPWTAEYNKSDGLWFLTKPEEGGKIVSFKRLGSRLEARFGVRHGLGSFSPLQAPVDNATIRSDSWKSTPRLIRVATERFGATRVLRKEDGR